MRHRRVEEKCTSMYNNVSKHDHLWETADVKKKCASKYKYLSKYRLLLVTEYFKLKCISMNNNARKQDHLWDKEDVKKNVRPCTIMHQSRMIYETQIIFKKMYILVQ